MLLIQYIKSIQIHLTFVPLLGTPSWLMSMSLLDCEDISVLDGDELQELVEEVEDPVDVVKFDRQIADDFLGLFLRGHFDIVVFQEGQDWCQDLNFVLEDAEEDRLVEIEYEHPIDPEAQLHLLVRIKHRRHL